MTETERCFVPSSTTIFIMLTSAVFASLYLLASARPWKRGLFIESITDCSQLPSYSNDTKMAGPWTIKVDSCYNGTAPEGQCSIEGFESGSDITRQREDRPNTIEHGFITIISDKNNLKTKLRCNGLLNTIEAYVLSGPDAEPIQAYRHYHHGEPVDGLFLGSNNQTNWSVHSAGRDVSITDMKPYWVPRLMIPETSIRDNEFRTLIRIDGS
ncbi:unnamed protein product [Penicillium nalgiovense]|nr:unnamed protein product [Penicillium nalgiovense]